MKRWQLGWVAVGVAATTALNAMGGLIISQYYEGASYDKWIEIYNPGAEAVDLTAGGYRLGQFSNTAREAWKTNGTPTLTVALSGTIAAGGTYVVSHNSATNPIYATADQTANWGFNEDDSVILYTGSTYDFANVVDAFGLTGSTAKDKSLVRTNTVTTGVNTDFNASEWEEFTNADANNAAEGTNVRIGYHSTGAVVYSVSFNKTTGFTVEEGAGDSITATAANGTAPYSYSWSSTLGGAYYSADTNVFTILATAPTGSYSATVVATDSAAQNVTNSLNFSVVEPAPKYAITVSPSVNGAATTTPADEAEAGEAVTINATPESGYAVDTISVVAEDSSPVTVNGRIFTMPAQAVTITVTFAEFTGSTLFISEVADPSGTGGDRGRFVELYNAGAEAIDLAAGQWFLAKQVNGGATWDNIALTGTVGAAETYVVAAYADYLTLYPTAPAPDQTSGNVNGSGDDGYFLYSGGNNAAGVLQDAYGVINEDGSGMPWEYTDSRAVRNAGVTAGNPTWTAAEWTITDPAVYADMTPGVHPDGAAVFGVTFNKATGFTVAQGASDTIVATAANGTAPYTYDWTSTLGGAYYTADTNVFTILATAPTGSYTATVVASDNAAQSVTNSIGFSVVALQTIAITPPVNGTVTTTPADQAIPGATVTVNATPDSGYAVGTITVTGADSSNIPVTDSTFTMPAQGVTVTVTFVVDIAALPIAENYTTTMEWTTLPGWSGVSISTYSDGDAAFNATDDALTVQFDGTPGQLTFDLQGRTSTVGTAPMQFVVEQSANGTDWTTVATIVDTEVTTSTSSFGPYALEGSTRYVRWTLANKFGFNLGLNNVAIAAGGPYLTYTGETTILMGESFSLLFTLHNATASGWTYTYQSADREELGTGSTNWFTRTPTSTGTYYLVMTALDEAVEPIATRELTLTVNPVDTNAPAVVITGDLTGTAGAQMNLSITLTNGTAADWYIVLKDPANNNASYNFDNPPTFFFTPAMAGTYVLTATAVDGSEQVLASKIQNLVVASGATPPIPSVTLALDGTGDITFTVPDGYALSRVQGATPALNAQDWTDLTAGEGNDYTVSGSAVRINSGAADARMIRIWMTP